MKEQSFLNLGNQKLQGVLLRCVRLCNPMDCSLPGFSAHGNLQARTLEWDAISILLLSFLRQLFTNP